MGRLIRAFFRRLSQWYFWHWLWHEGGWFVVVAALAALVGIGVLWAWWVDRQDVTASGLDPDRAPGGHGAGASAGDEEEGGRHWVAHRFLTLGAKLALVDSSPSCSEILAIHEVLSRASFGIVGLDVYFVRRGVELEADAWKEFQKAEAWETVRVARESFGVASEGRAGPFPDEALELSAAFGSDSARATEILDALFFVAAADGVVKEAEAAFLRGVAESLDVSPYEFRTVWNRYVVTEDGWDGGRPDQDESREAALEAYRRMFAIGAIVLSAKLTKADGRVTHSEVEVFRTALGRLPQDTTEGVDVASVFNRAKTSTEGFEELARELAAVYEPRILEALLDCLFEVAWADEVLHSLESEYLRTVAECFGFTASEFEEIRARWMRASTDGIDPYAVLGLSHDVSGAELKRRYRELVVDHHPDRLAAKGLPPEQMEAANARLAAINAAYDQILSARSV